MSDRKYRPVYMFIFMGLMLMVIMMNYSFNLIYYIQNRIYENAVKTLFPVETYFEDNYDENAGSVWVDSKYMFSMAEEDKNLLHRRMRVSWRQVLQSAPGLYRKMQLEMFIILQI